MAPLLTIEDLRTEIKLRRGVVHAIDGVSVTVDPGECLGIVGESGSGKTMTALSVMRLLPSGGSVVGGRIVVDGVDVARLPESGMQDVRGNLIGMIFQDPLTSLNPTMTIGEQIAESVRLHRGASRGAALARAVEVLGLVGMPKPAERVGNYPHQLSGGMRQRVMIAMALACEPKLLIADEPTTALDVTIQKQILELIDSLRQRLSMSVILVTHDLGVIAGRADRVAVMYAGRIVETAPTPVLFSNPRHPYTEALFEALPERAAEGTSVKRLYNIPGQPPDLTEPPPGCKFAPRCRYVRDSCRAEEPRLTDVGGSHLFRCYYPVGSEAEVRDPSTPFVSVPPELPEAPKTWADFWDLEKFPGKRSFWKYMSGALEAALIADGVAPDKLYPIDTKRAFKKLEELKDHIILWESGADSQRFLREGEVTMASIWNTRGSLLEKDTKGDVKWHFNQGVAGPSSWAVPKGAKNLKETMQFIAFTQKPELQLDLLKSLANGPANPAGSAMATGDLAKIDPGNADNWKIEIPLDIKWYADNYNNVLNDYLDLFS